MRALVTSLLGLHLLLFLCVASTARAWLDVDRTLIRSYADLPDGDSGFRVDDADVLPAGPLSQTFADVGLGYLTQAPQCASLRAPEPGACASATVLVAISRCLPDSALAGIRDWVNSGLGPSTQGDVLWHAPTQRSVRLGLALALLPATCAQSEYNTKSAATRLAGFTAGPILSALPSGSGQNAPIAVIALVGARDQAAYDELQAYARKNKHPAAITLQVCEVGVPADCRTAPRFRNARFIESLTALGAVRPVRRGVARFSCDRRLPGATAVAYRNADASIACLCACPAGSTLERDARTAALSCVTSAGPCDHTCLWAQLGSLSYATGDPSTTCPREPLAVLPRPFAVAQYEPQEKTAADRGVRVRLATIPTTVYSYDDVLGALPGDAARAHAIAGTRPTRLTPAVARKTPLRTEGRAGAVVAEAAVAMGDYLATGGTSGLRGLPVPSFGKFSVEATRWGGPTAFPSCRGCVAVVDMARPRATTTCPRAVCDRLPVSSDSGGCDAGGEDVRGVVSATAASLARAQQVVDAVRRFQTEANDVAPETAASCQVTGSPRRCDDEQLELREFFADGGSYAPAPYAQSRQCFDPAAVRDALTTAIGRLAASGDAFKDPTRLQREVPFAEAAGHCTRCCRLATALRKRWVDYRCGADFDTERCSGLASERCAVEQCVQITGDGLIRATAAIRPAVAAVSERVLDEHVARRRDVYQTRTQIHRAVPAACFDATVAAATRRSRPECRFSVAILALLDPQAAYDGDWGLANGNGTAATLPASRVVHWRYKLQDASLPEGPSTWWRLEDATVHDFAAPETRIALEAWTRCGLARQFFVSVHLHPIAPPTRVDACGAAFEAMWYRSTVSRLRLPDALCNYPGSNFVDLTFDLADPTIRGALERLECAISIAGRASAPLLAPVNGSTTPVPSGGLVRRFAVELIERGTTAAGTAFQVACTFGLRDQPPQACTRSFVARDCDPPTVDDACPGRDSCAQDDGDQQTQQTRSRMHVPPSHVCGGTVAWAEARATRVEVLHGATCCDACGPTHCVALQDLDDPLQDVAWCAPVPEAEGPVAYGAGAYADYAWRYSTRVVLAAAAAKAVPTPAAASMGTWLGVGGGALAGLLVALAQRRRRRHRPRDEPPRVVVAAAAAAADDYVLMEDDN